MLRLRLSEAQDKKNPWKWTRPDYIHIHGKILSEYYQMSANIAEV